MKHTLKFGAIALTVLAATALPASAKMSETAKDSLTGLYLIPSGALSGAGVAVHGSAFALVNGGKLVVESAKLAGEKTVILLRHVSTGAETVLETSGEAFGRFSQATGRTVEAVVTSAGTIIVESAKVILFIPTETSRALFESTEYQGQ